MLSKRGGVITASRPAGAPALPYPRYSRFLVRLMPAGHFLFWTSKKESKKLAGNRFGLRNVCVANPQTRHSRVRRAYPFSESENTPDSVDFALSRPCGCSGGDKAKLAGGTFFASFLWWQRKEVPARHKGNKTAPAREEGRGQRGFLQRPAKDWRSAERSSPRCWPYSPRNRRCSSMAMQAPSNGPKGPCGHIVRAVNSSANRCVEPESLLG